MIQKKLERECKQIEFKYFYQMKLKQLLLEKRE